MAFENVANGIEVRHIGIKLYLVLIGRHNDGHAVVHIGYERSIQDGWRRQSSPLQRSEVPYQCGGQRTLSDEADLLLSIRGIQFEPWLQASTTRPSSSLLRSALRQIVTASFLANLQTGM